MVHHELSSCQVRIFFNKNLEFSLILNCTVPSLMLFYNLMQSRVVSKGKIYELLGHYRRGPNLQNSFRFAIHYHAIYYCRYPWACECACIAYFYWNRYDAIGFVTWSLIQCIYALKCRVIIYLDDRFMNVRSQVPPTFIRTRNKRSRFLSCPLNFSKTLMRLRTIIFKNSHTSELCEKSVIFFYRNVLNTLVVGECNSVTLVSCMRAVGLLGLRTTTPRHCVYLDWNVVMWEEFHWRFLLSEVGSFG